ncbi:WD repeat-containing protein 38 isoform X2 [Notamacropus eugenii]|uniref:WD repeat-containing protein 38 isoform X2 n=1 Tax=Notamacropus eugenii TaxID=9315 RepID=UPI003B67D1FF
MLTAPPVELSRTLEERRGGNRAGQSPWRPQHTQPPPHVLLRYNSPSMPGSAVTEKEMPAVRGKADHRNPRKAKSQTTSVSSTQTPPSLAGKAWAPLTVGSIKYFSRHKGEVNSCAFSPDTRILLTCCDDNKVYMWGARTGNLLRKLQGHKGPVSFCRFSPDGKFFASASRDCTVRLWDAQTTKCLQVLKGHSRGVETVSFSSDSKQLASGGWDRKAILWEVQTGQTITQLLGHRDAIQSSDFSPSSEYLATGSWDSTVQVWDLRALDKIKKKILEGHKGNVSCVCFSPSGLLASGSWDKTICIWKPETGKLLSKLLGHLTWVKSMAFSADGLRMASSEYSEMVKIWDCTTGECTESLRMGSYWFQDRLITEYLDKELQIIKYLENIPSAVR